MSKMACLKYLCEKLQVAKGRQGRALESVRDKQQDIDFQHGQPSDGSSHSPWWDDLSHCCYVPLRAGEKIRIAISYSCTFFPVKSWAATLFFESMLFIVLGWLHGSPTFEETQRNIHMFKGKCAYDRCSFWKVLEINCKGRQEKSWLWELERRCTGQGGSQMFPTDLFVHL